MTDSTAIMEVPPGTAGPVVAVRGARGHFGRWLARRLAFGVVILLAVTLLVFVATQALPSNPSQAILGRNATPASVAALNHRLGLDKPIITQYLHWLGRLVRGHLGVSLATGQAIGSLLSNRVENSLTLLFFAAIIALPLSFFLGAITAVRRGPFDRILLMIGVVLAAMPDFVIAITLVILFATVVFTILPGVALVPPGTSPLGHPSELVLPVMTLVLLNVPYLYRLVRASMIDVLGTEYVAMARLKGMPPRIVIVRHALRNALLPAIQGSGIVLGWLLGSVVVVENVFQYPGLGSALTDAVHNRDLPVIQAVVLVFAIGIVLFNLTADALTIWLTPKLRTGSDL